MSNGKLFECLIAKGLNFFIQFGNHFVVLFCFRQSWLGYYKLNLDHFEEKNAIPGWNRTTNPLNRRGHLESSESVNHCATGTGRQFQSELAFILFKYFPAIFTETTFPDDSDVINYLRNSDRIF